AVPDLRPGVSPAPFRGSSQLCPSFLLRSPLCLKQRRTQRLPFYPSLPPAQRMSLTLQSARPLMPTIHKAMPSRKATSATRSLARGLGTHHVARVHNPQNPSRKPVKADKTARTSLLCTVGPLTIAVGRHSCRYHSEGSCPS